jgi:uncharacterized protein YktB (UPF0637 family)
MTFHGFSVQEFDIFDLPGFDTRMPALKARITPKLKALGEALTPRLREATGLEFYPHVALHLRRTVNAPEETWVAFSRSPRAYKPFVHTRVAINGAGIKIVCHLEDYADDKPLFAESLKNRAGEIAAHLAANPDILCYEPCGENGQPIPAAQWSEAALSGLAERLRTVKSQHASFALKIGREDPRLAAADSLIDTALSGMKTLLPLYRLGLSGG